MLLLQASREAITSVVKSLAVSLDVGGVFQGVPPGPSYALRTIVCYFGHHYQVCIHTSGHRLCVSCGSLELSTCWAPTDARPCAVVWPSGELLLPRPWHDAAVLCIGQAYALSEELNQWLLFDDTNIKFIGGWREVAASMRDWRLQPSLLFYERVIS
jgi:hypothetical protein